MKKKNLKQLIKQLSSLEENDLGQLQGGFSPIVAAAGRNNGCTIANNCKGGNCVPGCASSN